MILFFDTETTGLPKNWKAPVTDLDNWPRLVEIAWIIYDGDGNEVETKEFIVKPVGFIIPMEASDVHGIPQERALKEGSDLGYVVEQFFTALKQVDYVVAHNMSYDEKIMRAEGLRLGINDPLIKKRLICTKDSTTDFCAIPSPYGRGYKWPTLSELHIKLFGKDFVNGHNALADIRATADCFWELRKNKICFEDLVITPPLKAKSQHSNMNTQNQQTISIARIESYFSNKDNIEKILLSELDQAKDSIFVAVAWFTNRKLLNKLIEKLNLGITVELIITKSDINDRIDFDQINHLGGVFENLGDDNALMHNKFCVIDRNIVINGSYNWTIRANNANQENITLVSGNPKLASQFIEEFETLKYQAGITEEKQSVDEAQVMKVFNVIKALISINDFSMLNVYLSQIENNADVAKIVSKLKSADYIDAVNLIDDYIVEHSKVVHQSSSEIALLKVQIKLLSSQIETLEIERNEIEAQVDDFNHKFVLILYPLISKILNIKAKIFEKLKSKGIVNDEWKDAKANFEATNTELEEESKKEFFDLDVDEQKDIKSAHREAVKLCHPDSPDCGIEDKEEAQEVFNELTKAFKRKDVNRVKLMLNDLKRGNKVDTTDIDSDLEYYRLKYASLSQKNEVLNIEINDLKNSDEYLILKRYDIEEYIDLKKDALDKELKELTEKFVK